MRCQCERDLGMCIFVVHHVRYGAKSSGVLVSTSIGVVTLRGWVVVGRVWNDVVLVFARGVLQDVGSMEEVDLFR